MQRSVFGVHVTLENLVKLAVLMFSLGVIWNRIETAADRIGQKLESNMAIIGVKFDAVNGRMDSLEHRIDKMQP